MVSEITANALIIRRDNDILTYDTIRNVHSALKRWRIVDLIYGAELKTKIKKRETRETGIA